MAEHPPTLQEFTHSEEGMTTTSPFAATRSLLQDAATRIRSLEAQAAAALEHQYDTAGHAAALDEKCAVLLALPDQVSPFIPQLEAQVAELVQEQVGGMARRAASARAVNSVFFKACLLYPDEFEEGQRNELEEFLEELDDFAP